MSTALVRSTDSGSGRSVDGRLWRSWTLAILGVLAVLLLTGCGVQLQNQAEQLPGGALPANAPPSPAASARGIPVFFVSGRELVPVDEPLADNTASAVMDALAAGPPVDRQAELRTLLLDPLTGDPMLRVVSVSPYGAVVLAYTDAYLQLPAIDQVLLTGQVVHSLAAVGLSPVVITDESGAPVTLALPDGRVIEGPVTATDYAGLLQAK